MHALYVLYMCMIYLYTISMCVNGAVGRRLVGKKIFPQIRYTYK